MVVVAVGKFSVFIFLFFSQEGGGEGGRCRGMFGGDAGSGGSGGSGVRGERWW